MKDAIGGSGSEKSGGRGPVILIAFLSLFIAACGGGGTVEESTTSVAGDAATSSTTLQSTTSSTASPSTSSEPTEVFQASYSSVDVEDAPGGQAAQFLAEELEARSDGRIQVEVFYSGQLAGAPGTFDGLRQGTIQMGHTGAAWLTEAVPQFGALSLPYVFADTDVAAEVLDGPVGQGLAMSLEENAGVKVLGWYNGGLNNLGTSGLAIREPADLEGVVFRVIDSPVYLQTFEAWGANPVGLDFTEVYTALQQGTIDGIDCYPTCMYSLDWYEVIDNLTLTNHLFTSEVLQISADFFDSLPADLQQVVLEVAAEATDLQRQLSAQTQQESLDAIAESGVELIDVSEEMKQQLREQLEGVYEFAGEQFGSDFVAELLDAADAATSR